MEWIELVHDLKTPLAAILLEAGVLAHRLGPNMSPEIAKSIERLERNAEYLDRIVRDLLDTSAIDSGEHVLRRERVDVARLVERVVARRRATERGRIRLVLAMRVVADVDVLRVERVIDNLVENAFKFSPAGSSIEIRVDGGAFATITVTDAGPGLTAEQTISIFEKHRRGHSARDGVGIGLYASRRIAEAHGGRIEARSVPGRGACFIVELPVDGERAARSNGNGTSVTGLRVLIVEDELAQLDALADLLREDSMLVTTARDATTAIEALTTEPFDVALVDVQMPGIGGIELIELIRRRWPQMPIIVLTAFPRDHQGVATALGQPRVAYVGKPVDVVELHTAIAAFADGR